MQYKTVLSDAATAETRAAIAAPLVAYNDAQVGAGGHRPLVIRVEDEEGRGAGATPVTAGCTPSCWPRRPARADWAWAAG